MLLTKLHLPTPPKETIHRQKLLEKLDNAQNKKLVLVSAPAGYGKTILISDWIIQKKITAAWCSIDKQDNDPIEFLKIVCSAVQKKHSKVAVGSLQLLETPGAASVEYIIELFINDLLQIESETVLVLDDLHLITNQQVFEILSVLIEYKPQNLPLIISTRSDPPMSFSRLRSQNELLELRATDLSFSKSDISFLFNKKLKFELSNSDLNVLKQKTEGWIAGLQLTAITIQEQNDISGYLKKMAGDNRYIMDYLMEEVLNNQREEISQFLLKTSLFEKISASLCDAVLLKGNSQQILDSLEKRNMFLIPLDDERKWFRYHHLFADLLKQRFIVQSKTEIPELHDKASQWFEKNDMLLNAIEHAYEAGNKQRAFQLVNQIADQLWANSQYPTLIKLGAYYTKEELLSNTNFCIIYAWSVAISINIETAEEYLNVLLEKTIDDYLLGRIYETLNLIKVFAGDVEAAFKYSELATRYISDEDILWSAWAHISHGESHLLRFELEQCLQSFNIAREKALKVKNFYLYFIAETKSVYVLKVQGKYKEAYKRNKSLKDKFSGSSAIGFRIGSSFLYSIAGLIEVEQNNIEVGIQNALEGYELSRNATSANFKGYCSLMLIETYYKIGNLDEALKIVDELEDTLQQKGAQWLAVLASFMKCKLYIRKGELHKSDAAHIQGLRFDKNYTFERYYYEISKARLHLANYNCNQANSILEKLSEELKEDKAFESFIEVELLKAQVNIALNKKIEALNSVISAITYAQAENIIRIFISEGETIEELVKELAKEKKIKSSELLDSISQNFLKKLIVAFDKERKVKKATQDEILTSREIETIELIAQDLTNQQIADKLFVSLNTIKTRLKNIYLKLEVDNRRKAVAKAIKQGII